MSELQLNDRRGDATNDARRAAQRVERDPSAPPCPHGSRFITLCAICTPPLEKDERQTCIELMEGLGWRHIGFSQPHKASMTRGVSDDRFYPPEWNPKNHKPFWFEAKRKHDRKGSTQKHTREGQSHFRALVTSCGEDYVRGGLKELSQYLREKGIADVGIR